MTRRLILIRHAKSTHDDPRLADHDRTLSGRGILAARLLGTWLAERGEAPGEALVSSALRTRETWERIAPLLPAPERIRMEPRLYHASPDLMLALLRTATARSVVLIGHNPGIAELAARVLRQSPAHAEFARYPTGATLIADFPVDTWDTLAQASGTPVAFVVPGELSPSFSV